MTRAYMKSERAAPLWAVIGAPLVGVPLMVGLLALAAPREGEPAAVEPGFATEQVEVHTAEPAFISTTGESSKGEADSVLPC